MYGSAEMACTKATTVLIIMILDIYLLRIGYMYVHVAYMKCHHSKQNLSRLCTEN